MWDGQQASAPRWLEPRHIQQRPCRVIEVFSSASIFLGFRTGSYQVPTQPSGFLATGPKRAFGLLGLILEFGADVPVAPDRVKGLSLVLAVPPLSRLLLAVTLPLQVAVTLALLRGWLKAISFLRSSTVLASSSSSRVRLYPLAIRGVDKYGNIVVRNFSTRSVSGVLAFCQSL